MFLIQPALLLHRPEIAKRFLSRISIVPVSIESISLLPIRNRRIAVAQWRPRISSSHLHYSSGTYNKTNAGSNDSCNDSHDPAKTAKNVTGTTAKSSSTNTKLSLVRNLANHNINMWKWSSNKESSAKSSTASLASSVSSATTKQDSLQQSSKHGEDDSRQDSEDDSAMIIEQSIEADDVGNIAMESSCKKNKVSLKKKISSSATSSMDEVAKMFGSLMSNSSMSSQKSNNLFFEEENQSGRFLVANNANDDASVSSNSSQTTSVEKKTTTESIGSKLLQLMKSAAGGGTKNEKKEQLAITDIVAQVRSRMDDSEQYGDMNDPNSMKEIWGMFYQYKDLMKTVANKYVGNVNFKQLTPTAVFYYLEREDEIKNPSWKRRQHRFCQGIDMNEVQRLNDACDIAILSYADTMEEIRTSLSTNKRAPYELVYAELRSLTGQPANFVAVKVDHQKLKKKKTLEVIIVVRGTKTAADAFTDLLCDSEPYQGGKAHSFIVTSGIYIADKHRKLLLDLLEQSGAQQIDLTLIGHSLGAGAASIAGMEFNNEKSVFYSPKIKARVIGFGCPALVSEDLAKKSSPYITTVVNDSDVVPRMSGISVANMLHNVLEFDWREYAERDLECTLKELEKSQPLLFRAGTGKAVQNVVKSLLQKYGKDFIVEKTIERLPVELFPPGKCLHFYNDGKGISANFVPNTFFNEIDVTRRMIDGMCTKLPSIGISLIIENHLILLFCAIVFFNSFLILLQSIFIHSFQI